MGETLRLLGLDWSDESIAVRVRRQNSECSALEPLIGMRLSFQTDTNTARRCLGHVPWREDRAGYVDCDRPPEAGGRLCGRCAGAEGAFAMNLHHAHTRGSGELDAAIAKHLTQPNHLYLAGFRDGSIKVGTSTARRLAKRLAEQGAWSARILATTTDGYVVREIEDLVTDRLGVTQAVNVSRKLKGMVNPVDDAALNAKLDRTSADVGDILADFDGTRIEPADVSWHHPHNDHAAFAAPHLYPIDLTNGSHDFELVDACGPVVALTRTGSGDVFVTSLKPLLGLELELGDFTSDPVSLQDSLF